MSATIAEHVVDFAHDAYADHSAGPGTFEVLDHAGPAIADASDHLEFGAMFGVAFALHRQADPWAPAGRIAGRALYDAEAAYKSVSEPEGADR